MDTIYDLIIIGAGPAGITAAVYAARKRLSLLVLTGDVGGQAAWSGEVENYTGYQFVQGAELASKFEEHMKEYDIPVKRFEEVQDMRVEKGMVIAVTSGGEYRGRTAIVASGKRSRQLGVDGEDEFRNRGLTYCATCDGPLFSDKVVAIIGGGNSALDAALQLIRIASKVYIINIADSLTGDTVMREKVEKDKKVTVLNSSTVARVYGEDLVSGITVDSPDGRKDIPVQGVFVEIGLVPNTSFAGILDLNDQGEIRVNSRNETDVPGIFAAGDVTDVPEKQIIIAAGEGAKAALGVFRYISTWGGGNDN